MKPPSKKKPDLRAKADEIGKRYEEGKELCAKGGILCGTAKEDAMALTEQDGQKDKPAASVIGHKFKVGYYTRQPAAEFDEELFKDLFPKLYAKCLVTKTVFDPDMLKRLVEKKVIKTEQFNAAVVRPKGSRVVDIERLVQA